MCGIAGFASVTPVASAESILQRMTTAVRHRGPDDSGYYNDSWAHLGHRRLSIIDVAGGHQPMSNEDDSVRITYNGEVYNHTDLRGDLERAGHRYKTRCDTETILHAYEEYGPACVTRLRGMFAFAIWNRDTRTLFCARDRLGIKPLYYYWDGRVFAFASEIKAILEYPGVSAAVEDDLIPEYLGFGYVSGERTLFRNIRKLMPGHHLTLDLRADEPQLRIEQYWDVPEPSAQEPRDEREWIAETRRRLEESVKLRLMSDVPLGMFLSGGIDSSAVAAMIRRMTDGPVQTFSVGYSESKYSELGYASQVAKAIGTDHHEIQVSMDDFFNTLPSLIWHEDEPITWPSSVSLYFVSKLAAEHVKVVLTGEGSDEIFGGYQRYHWNLWNQAWGDRYRAVPAGIRHAVRSQIGNSPLLRASLRRKLGHTFLGREDSVESLYLDNFYCAFSHSELRSLSTIPPDAMYSSYLAYRNGRKSNSALDRMLYADQKTYLVELLMKQDQMSMACSIESRVPFLDHHLVEYSVNIPDNLKIRGKEQKYILKKAVEDLLPHDIVYRKKMGFPTPMRQWLLDPKADALYRILSSSDSFLASYLNISEVRALIDRHRSGVEDATDRIWSLLNLQVWGDTFIRGQRERWQDGLIVGEAAPSVV
jgi:asparagine synthase (glutamine-hydrolysing)